MAPDVEKNGGDYAHLTNTSIKSFGWEGISVTVKDRQTKQPKDILSSVNGMIKAGKTSLSLHYSTTLTRFWDEN